MKNNEQHNISGNTYLILKKDWVTPYNSFTSNDYSTLKYWASKLGKTTEEFIEDFNNGYLDLWFEIYT